MKDRFDELMDSLATDGKRLNQHPPEWRAYLEYVRGCFAARGIERPVVVEIGVLDGGQRRFYETLLGAEYIGIDINIKSPADIIGDSRAPATAEKLKSLLAGRQINLLFIDGDHTYEAAKSDYEIFGALTRDIIAIHDIQTPKLNPRDPVEVIKLWSEILATNKTDTLITIQCHNPRKPGEFNGRALGIGIIVKQEPKTPAPSPGPGDIEKPRENAFDAYSGPVSGRSQKVSVITRWFNEEFFAPYFLSHYSWADEIIVLLEKSTSDRSAEIVRRFANARIIETETGGVVNDRIFSDMMSDLAASLKSDWIIRADGDELIFVPPGGPGSREFLSRADGNVIVVNFHWIYRHRMDPDLDPSKPALWQRRHGGAYTIWPGMGPTFTKPSIVRPESKIRWRPGEQGYENSPNVKISSTRFNGVHWQMVDVEEAVRRLLSAEKRLSETNRKNNWGVRRFTEEMIRRECAAHLDDPAVI